jgi:heptosyltransferase II
MKNILVIQTAFLGDLVLTTSLLESLHRSDPSAHIDIVVRQGLQGLFGEHPFLRSVIPWDKREGRLRTLRTLKRSLPVSSYDAVIVVQRHLSSALLAFLIDAKIRIGFASHFLARFYSHAVPHNIKLQPPTLIASEKVPPFIRKNGPFTLATDGSLAANQSEVEHEIDRNFKLLTPLGVTILQPPKIYPTAADHVAVAPFIKDPFVTVTPGSVWATKMTAPSVWFKALGSYLNDGSVIFLNGGPSEITHCEALRNYILERAPQAVVKIVAGQLRFQASAVLMAHAKMNFVNDSAALHLASAVHAPVTAVFCSTLPEFGFGPIYKDNGETLELDLSLSCRSCGLHGRNHCRMQYFKCGSL